MLLHKKSECGNIADTQLPERKIAKRKRQALIADMDGSDFGYFRQPGPIQTGALREML